MSRGEFAIKNHFSPRDSADSFGFEASREFFAEGQRSRSKEHRDRFAAFEKTQKTEKIKENKS